MRQTKENEKQYWGMGGLILKKDWSINEIDEGNEIIKLIQRDLVEFYKHQ